MFSHGYFIPLIRKWVTRTSKAMQPPAIETVAKSLPKNKVILLNRLISNSYIPYTDLRKFCVAKDKHIEQLRVKVIGFRDFYADGAKAIEELSTFFNIPEEEKFKATIDKLEAYGGGDKPGNGLEALALAMKSASQYILYGFYTHLWDYSNN